MLTNLQDGFSKDTYASYEALNPGIPPKKTRAAVHGTKQ